MVNITLDIGAIQLEALVNVLIKYEKLIFDLDDTVFSEDIFDYLSFKSIASKFYLMGDIDADLYAKKGIMQKRISRKYLFDQISPVESKKYLRGAAIDPNLVGEPSANPEQFTRSSLVQ